MDNINILSIVDMFENCSTPHNYNFFINNAKTYEKVISFLDNSYLKKVSHKEIERKRFKFQYILINKETGAKLEVSGINENCRGKRSFIALYDDACSEELIRCCIKPISVFATYTNFTEEIE